MSAALQQYPKKCHSPSDDLQSVLWVAFEKALNHLSHEYSNMNAAARLLAEYDLPDEWGGSYKRTHLSLSPIIEFTGNPAFSELLSNFSEAMDPADVWEACLSPEAGSPTV